MDAAAEIGRNIPRVSTRMSLSVENEQADAERNCRTRLARLNSQPRTGTQGNIHFPSSADYEQYWQPYPVDAHSVICDDHTTYYTCRNAAHLTFGTTIRYIYIYIDLCYI